MAVRGVHHQDVDSGLGQSGGFGGHIAVDTDRRRDPEPPRPVDRRSVDTGSHRTGPGQHTAQRPVGHGQHRDRDRGVFEKVEHLARVGAQWRGDEIGHRDIAHPGETVDADGRRLGHQPDRTAAVDDDRHAMGTLMNQCDGVRDRILGHQRHRGIDHQVAALDEVDGRPDRGDRQILRQNHEPAAAGHRLGHPAAGHGRHIGDHHRDRGAGAVAGGQVDIETRCHLGAVGNDENVVVGQVIGRGVISEETHQTKTRRQFRAQSDSGGGTDPSRR